MTRKNRVFFCVIIVFGFAFFGCDIIGYKYEPPKISFVKQLDDTRFNGVFAFSYNWVGEGDTRRDDYKLVFNGTNKIVYSNETWINGALDSKIDFTFEIELNDEHTKYRKLLWNNDYDKWTEFLAYNFNSNGTVLTIVWYEDSKDLPYVFTKQ